MDRISHPDWVKLCVELNCAPNQNTFCYRHQDGKTPLLLNYQKNHGGDVKIFVKKKFVVDKKTNRLNSRVIAKKNFEVPAVM